MNSESTHKNIKSLIEVLTTIDSENIPLLKEKTLALYEQLVLLEHLPEVATVVEETIEAPVDAIFTLQEEFVDEATLKIDSEPTEIITLLTEAPISIVPEIEDDVEVIEEASLVEEEIEEVVYEDKGPELLHELESITEGFELPEFEPASPTLNSIQEHPKSLNEILNKSVQIGLNDRIAFINHLFDGSQEDYTRVISQVNTRQNPDEVVNFINAFVKPEYKSWEGKEAIEERFLQVVLKRFEV